MVDWNLIQSMWACDVEASCDLARSLPLHLRRSLFRFFLAAKQSFTSAAEGLTQPRRLTLKTERGANSYRGGTRAWASDHGRGKTQPRQKENGQAAKCLAYIPLGDDLRVGHKILRSLQDCRSPARLRHDIVDLYVCSCVGFSEV